MLAATACGLEDGLVSDLEDDETLVFFRTSASLEEFSSDWRVPIRGWVYEPEDSVSRMAAFESALETGFGLQANVATRDNLTQRVNLLIADNERDKEIVVRIAGQVVKLPPTNEHGHFEGEVSLSGALISRHASDGILDYVAVLGDGDDREFAGQVKLVEPVGLSIISDIDDTVKISNVTDKRSLVEQTFLLDFEAAPGMADLYRSWTADSTSLHFVSSSPWQLYTPLTRMLDDNGFPYATLSLKAVRFRDETLFDLFKKGTETKPVAINKILDAYPKRRFMLFGDSGEQDPEVYAQILRERPQQILIVLIRNVTNESPENERFATAFEGIDSNRWQVFDDPAKLEL